MREVSHRSKNLLSLVQAIAQQTATSAPEDFLTRFQTRLVALAASHDLLVKNEWKGIDLKELARSQLAHFSDLIGTRIELNGPPLFVCAQAAQTLGMTLHELATNAGKYGALSNDSGVVQLSWLIADGNSGGQFAIEWAERGGPLVSKPSRSGFGSTVISQISEQSLDAQVELSYPSTGFNWRLRCPVNVLVGNEIHRGERTCDAETRTSARPRVLVVEDDAFVALELAGSLQAAGFDILGPAGRVEKALALINASKCDAAVLDINLGSETSEPIARLLRQSGTPFVTVSGYAQHQFPDAFAGSDFLTKPVRMDALISVLRRRIERTEARIALVEVPR